MEMKNIGRRAFVAGGAAAAGALALGAAGCGSKSSDSGEEAASDATFTGGSPYSSTTYSPVDMAGGSGLMIGAIWHVYEGLYELDMTTYEPYPALAADEPEKVSDTEYHIALRDGAKFSDGTDVTVDDVVNAININISAETAPTIAPMLDFIKECTAEDDEVCIKLKYAFPLLQERLSLAKVFPKSATEDDMAAGPIGSGPYTYANLNGDEGGAIEFGINENYNGSRAAGVSGMTWQVLKDDTARTTAIVDGTVMVAESIPDANVEQVESAGKTVEYVDSFGQPFLMFNCQKKPFNDKRVRQAFFYAIDYEKLIANGAAGKGTMITGFLPESHENYKKASTQYTYDVDKAKSLLKEAGAEGLKFELMCNDNWCKNLSAQIQEDLKAAGMDVTLNVTTIDWATMAPTDDHKELDFDVVLTPGDPTCFGIDAELLMAWWYADNVWTQGRSCWKWAGDGKWEEMQGYMETIRKTDGDEKQKACDKAIDLLAEEVPLYGLYHRQVASGWDETQVSDYKPLGTTGMYFLGVSPAS